jgi:hypothetical protein
MTFSSTVVRKTHHRKVRPIRRQTRCGRSPVIASPSQRISPRSGSRKPFSALKRVVLPAPLGPMMPRISPARASKLTSASACRPRNALPTPRTSSSTAADPVETVAGVGATTSSAPSSAGIAGATAAGGAARRLRRRRQNRPSGANIMMAMRAAP